MKIKPDFVGVIHQFQLREDMKRELLMFDRIAVAKHGPPKTEEDSPDILWLRSQGVVFDCDEIPDDFIDSHKEIFPLIVSSIATVNSLRDLNERSGSIDEALRQSLISRYWHLQVRISAAKLRSDELDAVPVLQMHEMFPPGFQTSNEAVVRIVLKSLPQPDQSVALDEVVDFRRDKDAQEAVLRMRLWMTDLAKGEIDPIKARLTIASSISEYEESLRRNKIKTSRGTFEAIIVSSAEVLEDLVKFKWSAAAKAIFAIFKENAEFLEAEQKAPGRELAYIAKAQKRFDSRAID